MNLEKGLTVSVCNFFELSLNNKFIPKPLIVYPHLQPQKGAASQRYSTASLMCRILEHWPLLLVPIKTSAQNGPSWLANMFHDASQLSAPCYHPLSCLLSARVHFPFKHLTFSEKKINVNRLKVNVLHLFHLLLLVNLDWQMGI